MKAKKQCPSTSVVVSASPAVWGCRARVCVAKIGIYSENTMSAAYYKRYFILFSTFCYFYRICIPHFCLFPICRPFFVMTFRAFWRLMGLIYRFQKILSWNMSCKLLIFSGVLNRFYTWYESLKNIFIKNKRVEICENLLGVVFLFY